MLSPIKSLPSILAHRHFALDGGGMLSKVVHGVKSNTENHRMLDSPFRITLDGAGEGGFAFIAECC